jgi:membrane protein implicated in regulation of membrane protease activity
MPWSGASFLAYLGGFTILFATGALLGVLASDRGAAGFVLLALFVLAVSLVLAFGALLTGHRVTAGLFALTAVVSVVVFAGSLLNWFGWLDNPDFALSGFDLARLFLELLTVVASAFALAVFRFPLLVLFLAASIYFLVADLISNGGDWTAIVSILIGLVFLAAAVGIDLGESSYYGLWLHVAAGLVIGGGLLWFFHDGDVDFILVAVLALAYVAIGDGFARRVGAPADRRALCGQVVNGRRLPLLLPPVPLLPVPGAVVRGGSHLGARVGGPFGVRGGRASLHGGRALPRSAPPGQRSGRGTPLARL